VRLSSLPEARAGDYLVELGVHGPPDAVERAFAELERGLDAQGVPRA
jgi:hypothetical protein